MTECNWKSFSKDNFLQELAMNIIPSSPNHGVPQIPVENQAHLSRIRAVSMFSQFVVMNQTSFLERNKFEQYQTHSCNAISGRTTAFQHNIIQTHRTLLQYSPSPCPHTQCKQSKRLPDIVRPHPFQELPALSETSKLLG